MPKPEPPKAKKPAPTPSPVPEPVKPKKKFGFFSKKNANDRETDLNVLIGPNADAPEFALLLAKILTFGAPGRFPAIDAMGDMPFDKFDLDEAKEMLSELRSDLDLSDEKSAEIFASVVNCMIIDIVDLASATLKAKDKNEKLTVDALNVVMEFCDHAASLFDAVAKVSSNPDTLLQLLLELSLCLFFFGIGRRNQTCHLWRKSEKEGTRTNVQHVCWLVNDVNVWWWSITR
jgi:hypothetical protein